MSDRKHTLSFTGADGVKLVGTAWGTSDHPPVLFLHGGGQTRHAWRGTAHAVALDGWHAISLDHRGHGDSDWPDDGNYSLDAFADDLRAVAATFPAPPIVVGASLGGIAALVAQGEGTDAAAGAPSAGEDRRRPAQALVLVDIATRVERVGVERIHAFMTAHPDGFASVDEAADSVAEYLPHRRRPSDSTGLARNLRLHPDGRWRWHWDPRFMSGRRPPADAANVERLSNAARALSCPTLLVRGRESDILSEEGAREFLDLVPHARYADVSGAGHMVAGDRNDAFTAAVLDFLRGLRAGSG
jgi:pimeloyl-ACP methyl ester carboxylesterase